MKVFVTGATGFVGSAVVQELLKAGHEVLGLARNDEAAKKLEQVGAAVHRGDLTDVESLKSGAVAADAIIHTGFIHDFTRFAEVCAIDKTAIEAIGTAIKGTEKPFIITSGTAIVASDGIATEQDAATDHHPRVASEIAADTMAVAGVKVAVVRLPPSVHGKGDVIGFVPMLINTSREKGKVAYAGDGSNVWPAVNRLDAAKVFASAVTADFKPGTRFHAVHEEGIPFKNICEAIAKQLDLPIESIAKEDAVAHFGWFKDFAMLNNPASSAATRELLSWQPTHSGLLEDISAGDVYFADKQTK